MGDEAASRVFDSHCHLAFLPDPRRAARELDARGVDALCATVAPAEYARASRDLAGVASAQVALGLHPWWVADGEVREEDIAAFEREAKRASVFGEVGLDFSKRFLGTESRQVEAFERVLSAFVSSDAKAIFLHSLRAERTVLDMLEASGACDDGRACVLHWYSGSHDLLVRAIGMGCLFSVGPRMLATRRGRAYARQIPAERLLLESDLPSMPGESWSAESHARGLREAVLLMEELRCEDLAEALACAPARLLGLD